MSALKYLVPRGNFENVHRLHQPLAGRTARKVPARRRDPSCKLLGSHLVNQRMPLDGLRVLELAHVVVGPFGGHILASLGADVIRVEPPTGDIVLQVSPRHNGITSHYIGLNTNKRRLILDLKTDNGREVFRRLVRVSDIVFNNWRPQALTALGVDYESVRSIKPDIIYMSSSGFGNHGPLRNMGSTNPHGEAIAGWASTQGPRGARHPELSRNCVMADTSGSIRIVQGILAALLHRQRTGEGQNIEGSQAESCAAAINTRFLEFSVSGANPVPMGSAHPWIVPSQAFRARDCWVAIEAVTEFQWRGLCDVLKLNHLQEDQRYRTNSSRVKHRDTLVGLLETETKKCLGEALVGDLQRAQVPAGMFRSNDDLVRNPQLWDDRVFLQLHSRFGDVTIAGCPWRFSTLSWAVDNPPEYDPIPGAHSLEVLQEVGVDDAPTSWRGPVKEAALGA